VWIPLSNSKIGSNVHKIVFGSIIMNTVELWKNNTPTNIPESSNNKLLVIFVIFDILTQIIPIIMPAREVMKTVVISILFSNILLKHSLPGHIINREPYSKVSSYISIDWESNMKDWDIAIPFGIKSKDVGPLKVTNFLFKKIPLICIKSSKSSFLYSIKFLLFIYSKLVWLL